MKFIIILISFISLFINKFEKDQKTDEICTIYLEGGQKKVGEIQLPIKLNAKFIELKISGSIEKIELKNINKIEVDSNGLPLEFYNLKVYNYSGKKIFKDKVMMMQSVKGKVTLYTGASNWMATINAGNGWQGVNLNGTTYYCLREGEKAATLIHENFGQVNKNADFKIFATRYFADNAEIANKIKSKEYTYENIYQVILEYNK